MAKYPAQLKQLIADFRADLKSRELSFVYAQIGQFNEGYEDFNKMIVEQPKNIVSVNVLGELVAYLQAITRELSLSTPSPSMLKVATLLVQVMEEAVMGPCHSTQNFLARETELLDVVNRLLRKVHTIASWHSINTRDQEELESVLALEFTIVSMVLSLLDAGDKAVSFKPYYFNHHMALQMTGAGQPSREVRAISALPLFGVTTRRHTRHVSTCPVPLFVSFCLWSMCAL